MATQVMTASASTKPPAPYNTRRKSISLPGLGVSLPTSRSPPTPLLKDETADSKETAVTKKLKRSHDESSKSAMSMAPPAKRQSISKSAVVKKDLARTPPPSPREFEDEDSAVPEIDLKDIHDDIVEAVVVQLQKTNNRPHLVKQLAELLHKSVKIVETSANPSAIISSRLSGYLKRSCWNDRNPCPLAKELETVHPRRTYFYLTTCPHQAIPDPAISTAASEALRYSQQRMLVTPSVSDTSNSDEADSKDAEERRQMSPSPEIDLSAPDMMDEVDDIDNSFITPPTPAGSFSGRVAPVQQANSRMSRRGASPPLESDEKEFTQTARGMRVRKLSGGSEIEPQATAPSHGLPRLQGIPVSNKVVDDIYAGSPAFPASQKRENAIAYLSLDTVLPSTEIEWDLRSPETVDLDELDGMFEDF